MSGAAGAVLGIQEQQLVPWGCPEFGVVQSVVKGMEWVCHGHCPLGLVQKHPTLQQASGWDWAVAAPVEDSLLPPARDGCEVPGKGSSCQLGCFPPSPPKTFTNLFAATFFVREWSCSPPIFDLPPPSPS